MDVAERISGRIGREVGGVADARGLEVLANVIWAEIARALMDELGSALFAAGRPDEFRKVRWSIRILSLYEHSLTCEVELRDDTVIHSLSPIPCTICSGFSSNGRAPYFPGVRATLAASRIFPAPMERYCYTPRRLLVHEQAGAGIKLKERFVSCTVRLRDDDTDNDDDENSRDQPFFDVLVSCGLVGNDNLLGPERLCATARTSFLEADVADTKSLSYLDSEQPPTVPARPREAPPGQRESMIRCSDLCQLLSECKQSAPGDTPRIISRSSTPGPQGEGSSSESTAADDTLLRQYAAVIADVKFLESQTWVLWRDEVSPMLASLFIEEEAPSEHVGAEGSYPLFI